MNALRTAAGLAEAWATAVVLAVAHLTYPLRRRRRARHPRRAFRFSPQDRTGTSTPIGYQVARPATGLMQVIDSAASAPEFVSPPPRESVFAGVMGPTVPGVPDLPPLTAKARAELAEMHDRAHRDEVFKARVRAQEQLNKSLAKYGDRYRYRE